jgi:heme/copper-type cytochrome/quinol oxidase subunit 4
MVKDDQHGQKDAQAVNVIGGFCVYSDFMPLGLLKLIKLPSEYFGSKTSKQSNSINNIYNFDVEIKSDSMILKQNKGFRRREYELTGNNLKIRHKEDGQTKEWSVKLEDIGHNVLYESRTREKGYIISFFLVAFLIFLTVALFMSDDFEGNLPVVISAYIILGFIIALQFLVPLKKELYITGGRTTLTFFQDSPSVKEVNTFAGELIERSKKSLIDKFGRIDPDLPESTMMNQLNWLKNNDLISAHEYEHLKQEYKTKKLTRK